MSQLPLVDGVLRYIKENNISLCMPGHKGGNGFLDTIEGKRLVQSFIKTDITEVDGVDNLHHAEGIIKQSQELLSNYYKSYKSYFLVNGSTSGNLSMIFSAFNEGDKVIVERNCHRSIYNGIIMRKLKPVYIKNKIDCEYDAPLYIDEEHFSNLIRENKDAKGIIVTYPNYYGVCMDLEFIIKEAHKYNMKVLVDSAHGAHFGANYELPQSAVELGADMVVMSAHKTLPSLTQTAYLHISKNVDVNKVDFYVSAFLSTSPSYMFLCSMDYARFYLQEYGEEQYKQLLSLCNTYRKKINNIDGFHIIDDIDIHKVNIAKNLNSNRNIDLTRYIINVKKGYSGHKFLDYLRENKIQAEMSDGRNVILIFSPFNKEEDFIKLYNIIKNCDLDNIKDEYIEILDYNIPQAIIYPHEVINKIKIKVDIDEAEDEICGSAIVPYPPGIPIIMPGEKITKNIVNVIKYYKKRKVTILGIQENDIEIVSE